MPATVAAVLDAIPMPLVLVDAGQRVLAANDPAAVLFGEGLVGRTAPTFLRHPAFLDGLELCLNEGGRTTARVMAATRAGETHLSVTISPFESEGAGQGALIAFEDLTAQEQAVSMRRDFVANVSHELRTPLTALVGFIDTLRGAARDDAAARDRFLGIMEREAGRMIRLVNDLLSLSRVESEERRRPDQKVEILSLLKSALVTHREQAEGAGVALTLEAAREAVWIKADGDQLTQVFYNLIENAVKYGGAGKEVKIRLTEIDHEPVLRGPAVKIEFIDRGEGIDALHLPRITERFYRVDAHRSREKGGTGLGLAIVKHIVNRHRGRLRIVSEPGKGSNFMVILPVG
ncbi:MAG: PAS domain-containing protein [Proteobacteria bacterium]|nr:PAS domain-containing protein [Pseudomonadota bacterium]